ncbi:MAG: leucine-rich repeat domain-containing protein [Bacteroidales bacterium]|nr:leucine-rich repeat domain-containing protein [Bacteroidales bacterium]
MKKISKFLAVMLFAAGILTGQHSSAYTVTVQYNNNSGIQNANYTVTLDDSTVLGFNLYSQSYSYCSFAGAISTATSLTIPDSIEIKTLNNGAWESKLYYIRYAEYNYVVDFSQAESVTSLTMPATLDNVNGVAPTVKELHMNSYVSSVSTSVISHLEKVFVPSENLSQYYGNSDWYRNVLILEEGTEPMSLTINMTTAGEFAQKVLEATDNNWNKVNELTVTGPLSNTDLDNVKRCRMLTKLDLSGAEFSSIPNDFDYYSYRGFYLLTDLVLPELESIGSYAFRDCYRLKNITMPKVNFIGNNAFEYCGFENIILPDGITQIGSNAFAYNSQLTEIEIPSSLNEISSSCFYACTALKNVTIPSEIQTINSYAFYKTAIDSVDLPGVSVINTYAFSDCSNLKSIKLYRHNLYIYDYAFQNCPSLTEVDLPATTFHVDEDAFRNCSNLKNLICRSVTPPSTNGNRGIISDCDLTEFKLYVPKMSINNYRVAQSWQKFYTILPLEDTTDYVDIWTTVTIEETEEFSDNTELILGWRNNSIGFLTFNSDEELKMSLYFQNQNMGNSGNYNNNYYYNEKHTSLINNGPMTADSSVIRMFIPSTYVWYFISFPYDIKVSEIGYEDGCQFAIRRYSGQNRAQQTGTTWQNLTIDSVMHAYEGYILKCSQQDAEFYFPAMNNANNHLFANDNVIMPINEYVSEFTHNASWNLIGNPYPCYYDTRRMEFTAPITVWNRYHNRYDAFSPVDDEFILQPHQAFFVQRPADQEAITFNKEGRQNDATVREIETESNKIAAVKSQDRKVFNFILSNGTDEDRTRIVLNDNASVSYELDKDAQKIIEGDNTSLLLYSTEADIKFAINERPDDNTKVNIGMFADKDGNYTISLKSSAQEEVTLIDYKENTTTLLNDGDYTFSAKQGFNDNRFAVMFAYKSGLDEVVAENNSGITLDHNVLTANEDYTVYSVDGKKIAQAKAGNSVSLAAGVYVVVTKSVNQKIVVK